MVSRIRDWIKKAVKVFIESDLFTAVLSGLGVIAFILLMDMSRRHPENIFLHNFPVYIVSLVIGGLVGAFFSQKFRPYRRIIFTLLFILAAISGLFWNDKLGCALSFLFGTGLGLYIFREKLRARKKNKLTTFGSAEWADIEHLQANNLIGNTGFFLGTFAANGASQPLHYPGDRHLLTVAPTRSGKGVSSIIPNLLTYEGSVLVIDPKGENARITEPRRGKGNVDLNIPGMGQEVHIVDPWGITGLPSSCFNPLDWLRKDDPDINENAMMLADSIVTPHEGVRDQFWDEEAKALLMGLLLHVALDESERKNRSLGRVRDIICWGTEKQNAVFDLMQENPNPVVSSTAARTTAKEDKLRSNVFASLQSHTHFLDSPRIRANLSRSDFKFEDLKSKNMTVYLVLPADRLETFGRWLRLLIQQSITVNARNIETKPDKPVLFLLDEMAALGRLTMVEQAFSLMAGFGMQIWGIVQDLSQLDRIYGKGWETFIGNSGVLQYFGSRDHKTADYFSKLCGVMTIEKTSFARSIAKAIGSSWSSTSSMNGGGSSTSGGNITDTMTSTNTFDVVQRNLKYPDELMVLRKEEQLVLIENFNPIQGKKLRWFDDEYLKTLGVNLTQAPPVIPAPAPSLIAAAPAAPDHPADDIAPPAPAPGLALMPETYEKARLAAPGLDVHKIEQQWRNWIRKSRKKPKNPDTAFIGFCKKKAKEIDDMKTEETGENS